MGRGHGPPGFRASGSGRPTWKARSAGMLVGSTTGDREDVCQAAEGTARGVLWSEAVGTQPPIAALTLHANVFMTPIRWSENLGVALGAALLVALTNLTVFLFFQLPPAVGILWVLAVGAAFLGWHLWAARRSAAAAPSEPAAPSVAAQARDPLPSQADPTEWEGTAAPESSSRFGSSVPLHIRLRLRRPGRSGWWLSGMVLATLVFMFGVAQIIQLVTGPMDMGDAPFFRSVLAYVEDPLGWLAFALAAAVVIPVVEEFAFRGRMQAHLEVAWGGPVAAVLATSALFAVMHAGGPHPLLLVVPLLMGVFCGAAVILTGSIWSGVLLHGIWNGLMTLGTRTTGLEEAIPDPAEVSPTATLIWSVAMILLGAAGWIQLARPVPEGGPPRTEV
ncbi:MAG: CPBP family intramembrane metalloprotease [Gemmatimonadales bacterium]|nr:MAG: CPBP family intramembrane metalloprotease [Gemmatimonadales bacterium]